MIAEPPAFPHILCVDDNHDVSDSNALILSLSGFDAEACYDGFEALKIARDNPPDLCFIDLNMPGMNGDELAVRLRELDPKHSMTLVAVTAMSREEDVRRLSKAGFVIHLVKPTNPETLINIAMCARN
ncbi:response regulator [Zavarzinella formosa]|uniref:response regulator n=1 Tax=Zavarzinella formosa TaxID=360055 RepID=UPI0002E832B7|nr:response regulator [Zavarzinella formosa]